MFRVAIFIIYLSCAFAELKGTSTYQGTILKYYDDQKDYTIFAAAILSCQKKGGELVMTDNKKLNQAVADVAKGRIVWIGGHDLFGEGGFEWNDGRDLEWANWLPGEPNNANNGDEHCMAINRNQKGTWNDAPCCYKHGYVCQIPDKKSVPYENSKFTVYSGRNVTSYFEAERYCKNRRSRLALLADDDHEGLLSEMGDSSPDQLWVSTNDDMRLCNVASPFGVSSEDCDHLLPFVCEEVAPHGLEVSEEDITLEVGSGLHVTCTASGIPVPTVKWYRNGHYVVHQKRGIAQSTLILEDVDSSFAGMYVCKASNEVGGKVQIMEGYSFIAVGSEVIHGHCSSTYHRKV